MNKREIIYSILDKLKIYTDDAHFSEELVSFQIDMKRAMLLKQQYAKSDWHIPNEVKQELCLAVGLVNKVEGLSCAGTMLSTSVPLPRSIKIKGKEGPLAVRLKDGSAIPLSIIPIERIPFLFSNKYTNFLVYCAVDVDGKLIIISKNNKYKFLKSIKVTDIYESPDEAWALMCSTTSATQEAWDADYPIESAMADTVVDLIVKDLARTLSLPADNSNDATDEPRG